MSRLTSQTPSVAPGAVQGPCPSSQRGPRFLAKLQRHGKLDEADPPLLRTSHADPAGFRGLPSDTRGWARCRGATAPNRICRCLAPPLCGTGIVPLPPGVQVARRRGLPMPGLLAAYLLAAVWR